MGGSNYQGYSWSVAACRNASIAAVSVKLFSSQKVVLLWVLDPSERDAVLAYESVRKWRPGGRTLIEIASARSSDELFAVRRAYHARYKRSVEEDFAALAKEDFRKLLVPLITAYRYEGHEVNLTLVKSEAKLMHEKIEDKAYADEEIIRILTTRSKAQLAATFNAYHNEFGHPINKCRCILYIQSDYIVFMDQTQDAESKMRKQCRVKVYK